MMASTMPPVFDGHNDAVRHLRPFAREHVLRFLDGIPRAHLDLPWAREGGFGGGFFAAFVAPQPGTRPTGGSDLVITDRGYGVRRAPPLDPAYARRETTIAAEGLLRLENASRGQFNVVRRFGDVEAS